MTQPPPYPNQPGDPYGPPQAPPGQQWPPAPPAQDPHGPPTQDPYAQQPTSAQPYPTSAQPYPAQGQQYPAQGQPYGAPGQPYGTGSYPTGPMPTGPIQPFSGPPSSGPPSSGLPADPYTTGYQPGYQQPAPPKKRRGLMITLIVLAVAIVLCGGGGGAAYFVVQNNQGKGQATAVDAVNGFLKAVYKDKNTDEALTFVCPTSRSKDKLAQRIDDIRKYDSGLSSPTYTWPTPTVDKQDKSSATLLVPVKVATSDEKVAETKFKILATNSKGWWVCEITAG